MSASNSASGRATSLRPPGSRWSYLALAAAISAGLSASLIFINRRYLFHRQLYENGDPGFNALSVLRAKRFHQIYGAYSRWNLHHPGPALFYWFGWMEEFCYRRLHLVPTPFNAQVLAAIILNASFLAGAIGVAARWVRSPFFVPVTLLLAVLHYTAVGPLYCLTSTWPPYTMPMIFLALMLAGASVGAGQGDDLPLLVLAGSFAVHSNLAQPLFVVPLAVGGYLGLSVACGRVARATRLSSTDIPGSGDVVSAAPWRQFPRAHLLALMLLFAFLLPLFADLCLGTKSNLFLVFHNLPSDPSKHHPWLACVYYFLRFSAYKPSRPGTEYSFVGYATSADILHFCAGHLRMMILWLAALFSPLLALVMRRICRPVATLPSPEASKADPSEIQTDWSGRRRWQFVGWLVVCWLISVGLALCATHLLATEMFYYEGWFDYSIWFVLAIIGAVSVSDILESCAVRTTQQRLWPFAVAALSLIAIAWTLFHNRSRFEEASFADAASLTQAEVVKRTLAEEAGGSRMKVLSFPETAREAASGVAVLLERLGYQARVRPEELTWFGPDFATADLLDGLTGKNGAPACDFWRIAPAPVDTAAAASRPLIQGYALVVEHPEIDPSAGSEITFSGRRPNYDRFALFGWMTGIHDVPFIWSEGRLGLICFRPKPIPAAAAVEAILDGFPLLRKGFQDVQRIDVGMNDYQLGTWRLDQAVLDPLPRVLIPAAIWNQQPLAILTLRFRDAISPEELHENDDNRKLALGTRKISFRTVEVHTVPAIAN